MSARIGLRRPRARVDGEPAGDAGGMPQPPALPDDASRAIWQYLERLERAIDHVDARIDHLYLAIGGGTVLLSIIGLAAGFIARGG